MVDYDDIIQRLRAEAASNKELLRQIRRIIDSDPEFENLSLVGGVKTILRRYHEQLEENKSLNAELSLLMSIK